MFLELLLVGQITKNNLDFESRSRFIYLQQQKCMVPYSGQPLILDERVNQILTSKHPSRTIKRLSREYPDFMKHVIKDLIESGYILKGADHENHKKTTNEDD